MIEARRARLTIISLFCTSLIFVLDVVSKRLLLYVFDLPNNYPVAIGPFFDLTVAWNRGISYGLFQQDGVVGRWILIGISIIAFCLLFVWMLRTSSQFLALSISMINGGAMGNVIDRIQFGSVFDFIHFHIGSFSWYVFNIADVAIVIGVCGILYNSFFLEQKNKNESQGSKIL